MSHFVSLICLVAQQRNVSRMSRFSHVLPVRACPPKITLLMTYLGKILMVGTWHFMWNTLGQRSQHSRSPPLIQTAHQSSLGSSSFPLEFSVPAVTPSSSVTLSAFPFVSGALAALPFFSEHDEVAEVVVVAEGEEWAALEPFSAEQGVSDWGSVLMRSPKALRGSAPIDTDPKTGRGLFSGLLNCGKMQKKKL